MGELTCVTHYPPKIVSWMQGFHSSKIEINYFYFPFQENEDIIANLAFIPEIKIKI